MKKLVIALLTAAMLILTCLTSYAETTVGVPEKLRAAVSDDGTVTLRWDKTENADAYRVYIYNSDTKTYKRVKTVKSEIATVKGLAAGKYYFKVAAAVKIDNKYTSGKLSKSVKAIVPEPPKYLALSFDDGPNTTTTMGVLDVLEKYDIPASFFLVGQNIKDDTKPVLERMLSLGCDIENHSYTHSYINKMTEEEILSEIKKTDDRINELVGVTPSFFRPPYIATSDLMYELIDKPFICGVGCNDWDAKVTAERRVKAITTSVKDGDIILLHDAEGNSQTVDALPEIIEKLEADGFVFVTVDKLFEIKGADRADEYMLWTNVKKY